MSPQGWRNALHDAEEEMGCGYDWFADLRFVPLIRLGCFWIKESKQRWMCSEFAHWFCRHGGVTLLDRVPDYEIDPRDLRFSNLLTIGTP